MKLATTTRSPRRRSDWLIGVWRLPGAWLGGAPVRRMIVPSIVSAAVHAAVLVVVVVYAWSAPNGPELGPVFEISFDAPAAVPDAPRDRPDEQTSAITGGTGDVPGPIAADAGVPDPPRLVGLSSGSGTDLPRLESAAGRGRLPVLERTDEPLRGPATFAGLRAERAVSVVYVVDASGAMVSSFSFVIPELERSIARLSPLQRFQVVLFRDRPDIGGRALYDQYTPPTRRDGELMRATATNKAAVSAWLARVQPMGRSNPLDGLVRALDLEPDAVFLLSRSIKRSVPGREATLEGGRLADPAAETDQPGGVAQPDMTARLWGRGKDAILAELDRLNPVIDVPTGRRRVQIKTIQFIEDDPSGILQAIAELHGDGDYRVLTLEDLGR